VARKALGRNLSDLAARAPRPRGFCGRFRAAEGSRQARAQGFARGLRRCCRNVMALPLIDGETVLTRTGGADLDHGVANERRAAWFARSRRACGSYRVVTARWDERARTEARTDIGRFHRWNLDRRRRAASCAASICTQPRNGMVEDGRFTELGCSGPEWNGIV